MPDVVLNSKCTEINRTWFLASKCYRYNKTMNQVFKMLYSHILNFILKWINVSYLSKKSDKLVCLNYHPVYVCLLNLCSGLAQERQLIFIDSTPRKPSIWMESIFPSSLCSLFILCIDQHHFSSAAPRIVDGPGDLPKPGNLPNPGIEPRSNPLQADSLPSEPPGKPLDL